MAEPRQTVSVRLLDNMAYGPDIDVPEALVWNCEVVRHKGRLYYFEGVNQYGQRVFRLDVLGALRSLCGRGAYP
jgi:hypothetical protein